MSYRLENLREKVALNNPVVYRFNWNATKWRTFELMNDFVLELDNGNCINFEKGFEWDLSSVPKFIWWLLKPFGRFDLAYLAHDKVYQLKGDLGSFKLTRKQADDLMLDICLKLVGTKRISFRKIDAYTRYIFVRLFGWVVWNKKKQDELY